MRRFHEARIRGGEEVVVGEAERQRREFLHVDDSRVPPSNLMEIYNDADIVNVGTGADLTIRELAELIARVTGYRGRIVFDTSKPDGTCRGRSLTCQKSSGWAGNPQSRWRKAFSRLTNGF